MHLSNTNTKDTPSLSKQCRNSSSAPSRLEPPRAMATRIGNIGLATQGQPHLARGLAVIESLRGGAVAQLAQRQVSDQ